MSPRFMYSLGGTVLLLSLIYGLSLSVPHVKSWLSDPATTTPYRVQPLPSVIRDKGIESNVSSTTVGEIINTPPELPTAKSYFEVTTGCAININTDCVTAHSAPNASSSVRASLRIGMVLLTRGSTTTADGTTWYQIEFDEPLRFADRLSLPWYIPSTAGTLHSQPGVEELSTSTPSTTKSLIVDRSSQTLTAYDNGRLVRTYNISTGLDFTPTPRGQFTIYRKTPTRYMQGPIAGISDQYYDLPGVPWNLYFTKQGAVVHGAYWHNSFGQQYSHGCVNVDPKEARELYEWADLGMMITVRD